MMNKRYDSISFFYIRIYLVRDLTFRIINYFFYDTYICVYNVQDISVKDKKISVGICLKMQSRRKRDNA